MCQTETPGRRITSRLFASALLALGLLVAPTPAVGQDAEPTLYERLGGVYPIATVVDLFIDFLLANPTLNANPRIDEARRSVPPAGLKHRVTSLVCQATGGPCVYTGRGMDEAHAHLDISEEEWSAMLGDLRRTLDHFEVPEREQRELIAIVESTKDDIVVR